MDPIWGLLMALVAAPDPIREGMKHLAQDCQRTASVRADIHPFPPTPWALHYRSSALCLDSVVLVLKCQLDGSPSYQVLLECTWKC